MTGRRSFVSRVVSMGLPAMVLLAAAPAAVAFDAANLWRQDLRLDFWEHGNYVISVSDEHVENPTSGYTDIQVYYKSNGGQWYDPLYHYRTGWPITVQENADSTVLTSGTRSWTVTDESIVMDWAETITDPNQVSHLLMRLNPVRFDDALMYERDGGGIKQTRLRPYEITTCTDPFDHDKVDGLLNGGDGYVPTHVMGTEEGLWAHWKLDLDLDNITHVYNDPARLMITSGSDRPSWYNALGKPAGGNPGTIDFRSELRVTEDDLFPVAIPESQTTTMVDSHVHLTTLTDLRDSVLMARKHGYQFGLCSIYYDEGRYRRLFTGDEQMFDAMIASPETHLGFGNVRLNEEGDYPGFNDLGQSTPEDITELWLQGCRGLKNIEKWKKTTVNVNDPSLDPIYERIEEYRFPLTIHTEAEGYGCSHTRCADVAERFPGIPVLLAHESDGQLSSTTIPLMQTIPNLYIQHMHLNNGELQALIDAGLIERVIFGSDVTNDHGNLVAQAKGFANRLETLGVPRASIDRIMYQTTLDWFANVKTPTPGDFNGDEIGDITDVDLFMTAMADGPYNIKFDLDRDGDVDADDHTLLIETELGTAFGDTDLDGDVDLSDLSTLAGNWDTAGAAIGWSGGDLNGDRAVDIGDLSLLAANWGFPAAAAANVPEPATALLLAVGAPALLRRRRRP